MNYCGQDLHDLLAAKHGGSLEGVNDSDTVEREIPLQYLYQVS